MQDAVKSLENTRFRGVADAMAIYQKYNLVSVIEAFLDKIYFDSEVRPCLDAVPDSMGIEEMVGTEVDLMDVKTLIDLKARGVSAEEVRRAGFLPYRLKAQEVVRISEASLDSIPRVLSKTRYADLAQPIQNALDPAKGEGLDRVMRSEIQRRTKPLMFRWAISFGYVLGYLREVETEANNLISIVTGKELGLGESEIEATLCA
jgi:vacuolar-type H+-ATPase subunit C/Vma6